MDILTVAKRRVRKRSTMTTGDLTVTLTWGTDFPAEAWAFVITECWVSSTAASGGGTGDIAVSVDGGAQVYNFLRQSGFANSAPPTVFGYPIYKTDGTLALPVISFVYTRTGGTNQLFVNGYYLYSGDTLK